MNNVQFIPLDLNTQLRISFKTLQVSCHAAKALVFLAFVKRRCSMDLSKYYTFGFSLLQFMCLIGLIGALIILGYQLFV